MSIFAKPAGQWSDRELAIGLAEVARSIQEQSDLGHRQFVDDLHAIARGLADERDRRRVARSREVVGSWVDISDLLRLEEADEWPWPST
ncbi:MAG: hypothetical protein ACRDWI_06495 [Jiangellaceae bacterium]